MARSIDEIFNSLMAAKDSEAALAGLTSTSKVSIWRLVLYVVAVCQWVLESLFDLHKQEVSDLIEQSRVGYIPDMRNSILNFQYGYDLVSDETYYDNTGLDEDTIVASRIVKHVVIVELTRGLLVKVAREVSGAIVPLAADQLTALTAYIGRIKPPGVSVKIVNQQSDKLKLNIRVYYNPLILDGNGKRIDGSNDTPIQAATDAFLKRLPFNGQYIINRHQSYLEGVDGVVIATILSASASYANTGDLPFNVFYLPDSGYLSFALPSDLNFEFVPHESV